MLVRSRSHLFGYLEERKETKVLVLWERQINPATPTSGTVDRKLKPSLATPPQDPRSKGGNPEMHYELRHRNQFSEFKTKT